VLVALSILVLLAAVVLAAGLAGAAAGRSGDL